MSYQLNYTKGLFFKNEQELERALFILREYGFLSSDTIESASTFEAMMHLENERLAKKYHSISYKI